MIIVRFKGGLGNQLFQYSLYRNLEIMGRVVKADLLDYGTIEKRTFELANLGFELKEATLFEIEHYRGSLNNVMDIIKRRFNLKKGYWGEREGYFNHNVFELDSMYVDGFWQNQHYFDLNNEIIISEINEKLKRHFNQSELLDEICNTDSVSIHIRRGDYIDKNSIYTDLCKTDYYMNAIEWFRDRYESPRFFVFSDDIDWARNYFKGQDFRFVIEGRRVFDDLFYMSQCKNNIIANSTYSWWASHLNTLNSKVLIAPIHWFNTDRKVLLLDEKWVRL